MGDEEIEDKLTEIEQRIANLEKTNNKIFKAFQDLVDFGKIYLKNRKENLDNLYMN